jgi:hypothetical protein
MNNATLCGVSILQAKATTIDLNVVDCLACLWAVFRQQFDQMNRCAERIRVCSQEAINKAEYRIGGAT